MTIRGTLVAVVLGALVLVAAPASAAASSGLVFGFSFTNETFDRYWPMQSLATSEANGDAGDVFVAGAVGCCVKVDNFTASGTYLSVHNGGWEPDVAVDNSTSPSDPNHGDVYLTQSYGPELSVQKINATGEFEPAIFTATEPYISGNTITGTPTEPFSCCFREPVGGLAVDSTTGDLYVATDGRKAVHIYHDTGEYAGELAGTTFSDITGVAVNATTGQVYVADSGTKAVDIFNASDSYEGTLSGVTFGSPYDVAVDQATQEVYVTDNSDKVIDVFDSAGALTSTIGDTGPEEPLGDPLGITFNATSFAAGALYVADQNAPDVDVYFKVEPGSATPATTSTTNIEEGNATLNGEFDPAGAKKPYFFAYNKGSSCDGGQYSSFGTTGTSSGSEHFSLTISGLEPNTEYSDCFKVAGAPASNVITFKSKALPPVVGHETSVSGITASNATVSGTVAPEKDSTTDYISYGTKTVTEHTTTPQSAGEGLGEVPVTVELKGLESETTYHYRLVATSGAGRGESSEGEFTTDVAAPAITVGEVSEVTPFSAILNGTVNPNALKVPQGDTTYCFEYGTTQGYNLGFVPGGATGRIGVGKSPVAVNVPISGLNPDTTYHYRLVAVNAQELSLTPYTGCHVHQGQATRGPDESFTTLPLITPPIVTAAPAREVGPNSATIGGSVNPVGIQTTYQFQIGSDTSYGADVFGAAGAGSEPVNLSLKLTDLAPETTYHYRLVASSAGGTTYGPDESFTTTNYPGVFLTVPTSLPLIATPVFTPPSTTGAIIPTEGTKAGKKGKGKSRRANKAKTKARKGTGAGKRAGTGRRVELRRGKR